MTRQQVIDELRPLARRIFEQPSLELDDNEGPETVSSWNSLSFTNFLTAIESTFNIKFSMMEILHFQNMGDIIDTIAKYVA